MRTENDFIGPVKIPKDALYGIHSVRAKHNFPDNTPFHIEWFRSMALVKRACYLTSIDFRIKATKKDPTALKTIQMPDIEVLNKLVEACIECENSKHYEMFIVPAISGGAGTSINMNCNEILTNLALLKLGSAPGNYDTVDPIEDANIFQSTNDVVPTALRIASMQLLLSLEEEINLMRMGIEKLEKTYRNSVRIAYTQMQEAVPSTYGKLFSTYSDALSRDWWRISKCLERIKVVNLGGSAIGTSITIPRYFTIEVVKTLQQISNLPITRGENLCDATSNLDPLVEVHGIIKAHAVNLEKMVNDIRLLSSDIYSVSEVIIPKKQVGSSIMPGKINPVIPEFVISSIHRVYSNDQLITTLSAQGCLELNAYIPVIGHAILESLKLLIACNKSCSSHLFNGLKIDSKTAGKKLFNSPSVVTALVPYMGYNNAAKVAQYMRDKQIDIFRANADLRVMDNEKLKQVLKPENLIQSGFRLKDL